MPLLLRFISLEFKIIALTAVRELFSSEHNCFYAGFGNRLTDIIAYRAVGVPATKIFIVNANSQIQHVNTLYTKSYPELAELTDLMFPNRTVQAKRKVDNEFNTYNYWKTPIDLSVVDQDLQAQKQKQKEQEKQKKSNAKNHVNGGAIRKRSSSVKRHHR
jgi:phosphatidate phosphatase LPIN